MKRNIGKTDRIIRVLVGLIVIGLGVFFNSWWGALGLLPIVTAVVGWCPPYRLLGISTHSVKE